MSAVFGPVSSLPGSLHLAPQGQMCDTHPDRLAVRRVQGETDSMGCEMTDMCQECLDADRAYVPEPRKCDWCDNTGRLKPRRDYDEGMSGPVYHVCWACIVKQNEDAARELGCYDHKDWLAELADDLDDIDCSARAEPF